LPKGNAFTGFGLPSEFYPTIQREVNTLGTVEAQIETGMITPREGDDELPGALDQTVRLATPDRE
jgi:hypothetical protein